MSHCVDVHLEFAFSIRARQRAECVLREREEIVKEMREAESWGGDQCENGSQECIAQWADRLAALLAREPKELGEGAQEP